MPLAQSTFPAVDMLVLAFLVGFGLAAAVFVPLLRHEHRRGGRRSARSGRSNRTRPGAERASTERRSPGATSAPEAHDRESPPVWQEREADGEDTLPGTESPQEAPTWEEAERTFGTTTSRWEKRVELCTSDCAVRFGRARARLSNVTGELGIEWLASR